MRELGSARPNEVWTRSACLHDKGGSTPAGEAAEDGAGHQPGAARVIVVVEPADDFAGGPEARDRAARLVLDLGAFGDLEPARR